MRISTDVASLTSARLLERSDRSAARSLERLSSGARINRATDDAGGLSISEGLLSRSCGLRQAGRNARDGIDLLRTADGALAETTSVLQRMRDLAVRAANDGGLDAAAKDAIQREVDQLTRELTRIATTTAHSGTSLLDGSYLGTLQVGAEAGDTITVAIGRPAAGMDAAGLGVAGIDVTRAAGTVVVGAGPTGGGTTVRITPAVSAEEGTRTAGSIALVGDFTTPGLFQASYTGLTGTIGYDGRVLDLTTVDYTGDVTAADYRRTFNNAVKAAFGLNGNPVAASTSELVITGDKPGNGSTIADAQRLSPAPPAAPGAPAPVDVVPAVRLIDGALQRVSSTRADLGAIANRLEHTVARLGVAFENTTASFSRIRDADMATEMTGLTRNQVLVQAGSAMLAQANQTQRGALRLLA